MGALHRPDRDLSWVLAAAVLSLGLSLILGRYQGRPGADFACGFFVGLALALSAFCLVFTIWRRRTTAV